MDNIEFLNLAKENPELPIIPFTYYEVCSEDHSYWMGKFENCQIDEYLLWNNRTYFKSDMTELCEDYYNNNDDEIWEQFGIKAMNEITEEINRKIDEYIENIFKDKWKKAIIIYIGLPE